MNFSYRKTQKSSLSTFWQKSPFHFSSQPLPYPPAQIMITWSLYMIFDDLLHSAPKKHFYSDNRPSIMNKTMILITQPAGFWTLIFFLKISFETGLEWSSFQSKENKVFIQGRQVFNTRKASFNSNHNKFLIQSKQVFNPRKSKENKKNDHLWHRRLSAAPPVFYKFCYFKFWLCFYQTWNLSKNLQKQDSKFLLF